MFLPDGRTVWLFNDTFLGPVNPDRTRPETAPLIHNSLVVQDGATLTTIHGGSRLAPRALFTPRGASWYWIHDGTVEGVAHRELPVLSVQYHPEAAPGPHDSRYLFDRFIELMEQRIGSRR